MENNIMVKRNPSISAVLLTIYELNIIMKDKRKSD